MTNAERLAVKRQRARLRTCTVKGGHLPQDRASGAHHFCAAHYMRLRRFGSARPDVPVREYRRARTP